MVDKKRNIDELCTRLSAETLAFELATACRDHADGAERTKALREVLQRHLDALVVDGGEDAKAPFP